MKLIHFGASVYDKSKFKPVKNGWVKPSGGLWTSPVESAFGWRDWCHAENFRACDFENSFTLKLNSKKVVKINSLTDLLQLPLINGNYGRRWIDFENIYNNGYDAIWLTDAGENQTRHSDPSLYGWDCESVLILNPDCVTQIMTPELCQAK